MKKAAREDAAKFLSKLIKRPAGNDDINAALQLFGVRPTVVIENPEADRQYVLSNLESATTAHTDEEPKRARARDALFVARLLADTRREDRFLRASQGLGSVAPGDKRRSAEIWRNYTKAHFNILSNAATNTPTQRRGRRIALAGITIFVLGVILSVIFGGTNWRSPTNKAIAQKAEVSIGVDKKIYARDEPKWNSRKIGNPYINGAPVEIACEAFGENFSNGQYWSDVWEQLTDGTWLPNGHVLTGYNGRSEEIPLCE